MPDTDPLRESAYTIARRKHREANGKPADGEEVTIHTGEGTPYHGEKGIVQDFFCFPMKEGEPDKWTGVIVAVDGTRVTINGNQYKKILARN